MDPYPPHSSSGSSKHKLGLRTKPLWAGRFHCVTVARVQDLAARLIRGEVIEFVDERRRRWQGTAISLSLALSETADLNPVVDGADAYTVAVALATAEAEDLDA